MAKKVFMIAPFEAMTGNLSGDQDLQYAENNNPAYEAPNGTQYARNYMTRYVGARRGKDGLVYFQVKKTTATVLTASSRRTMAILGVTAAIRSALVRNHPTLWGTINEAFEYLKAGGRLPEGQETFNKWFAANIKNMIVYKRPTWSFSYVPLSFTIHNPYDMTSAEALQIKASTWLKFADMFAFNNSAQGGIYYFVDGVKFFAPHVGSVAEPQLSDFDTLLGASLTNLNYKSTITGLALDGSNVHYNGLQVYSDTAAITDADTPEANQKLSTIAPQS